MVGWCATSSVLETSRETCSRSISLAEQIGLRARERVGDEFTRPRSLLDYLAVIKNLLALLAVCAAA
jgi:hypothetical protein